MTFLEQEEVFHITLAVKEKLLAVSSAAVNRKLKEERKKSLLRGFSGNKRGKYLKHTIPVNHRFSR
ncbi:MAG: hypothetical protein LBC27_07740 [Spirochaetaceae bacterium]|nr:hypothetical protein [Spirochaetaceae bacterium]